VCSHQMCTVGAVVAVAVGAVVDDVVVEFVEDPHNTQLLYNHLFQLVHH
jgi:hypothetical protein